MHPVLFRFHRPDFLSGGEFITFYSYGFFMALGVIMAISYVVWRAKKELAIPFGILILIVNCTIIAGLVGAKVFSWFEKPKEFFLHPVNMILHNSSGFVLYGALIFIIPLLVYLTRKFKIPTWNFLDLVGIAFPIMFIFVRIGCFSAGCCYGVPTTGIFGVVFSNPDCQANPKDIPLHPTQLYSIFMLLCVLIVLWFIKKRQKFQGQIFLWFLVLYGIGRSFVEIFRGDNRRGFIIQEMLTYAQFISIVIIIGVFFIYKYLRKKQLEIN